MPPGVPGPGGLDATVAVNVAALVAPGEEFKLAVEAWAWTFCTRVALPPGNAASPLCGAVRMGLSRVLSREAGPALCAEVFSVATEPNWCTLGSKVLVIAF